MQKVTGRSTNGRIINAFWILRVLQCTDALPDFIKKGNRLRYTHAKADPERTPFIGSSFSYFSVRGSIARVLSLPMIKTSYSRSVGRSHTLAYVFSVPIAGNWIKVCSALKQHHYDQSTSPTWQDGHIHPTGINLRFTRLYNLNIFRPAFFGCLLLLQFGRGAVDPFKVISNNVSTSQEEKVNQSAN